MSITCRGLRLCMTKQTTNDREALAKRDAARSKGVAKVMDSNVWEISEISDPAPGFLHVGQVLAFDVSRYDIGIIFLRGMDFSTFTATEPK